MSADSVVYVRLHFTDDAYSIVLEVGTQIHLFVPWLGDPELAEYIDSRLPPSPLQTAGIPRVSRSQASCGFGHFRACYDQLRCHIPADMSA